MAASASGSHLARQSNIMQTMSDIIDCANFHVVKLSDLSIKILYDKKIVFLVKFLALDDSELEEMEMPTADREVILDLIKKENDMMLTHHEGTADDQKRILQAHTQRLRMMKLDILEQIRMAEEAEEQLRIETTDGRTVDETASEDQQPVMNSGAQIISNERGALPNSSSASHTEAVDDENNLARGLDDEDEIEEEEEERDEEEEERDEEEEESVPTHTTTSSY